MRQSQPEHGKTWSKCYGCMYYITYVTYQEYILTCIIPNVLTAMQVLFRILVLIPNIHLKQRVMKTHHKPHENPINPIKSPHHLPRQLQPLTSAGVLTSPHLLRPAPRGHLETWRWDASLDVRVSILKTDGSRLKKTQSHFWRYKWYKSMNWFLLLFKAYETPMNHHESH